MCPARENILRQRRRHRTTTDATAIAGMEPLIGDPERIHSLLWHGPPSISTAVSHPYRNIGTITTKPREQAVWRFSVELHPRRLVHRQFGVEGSDETLLHPCRDHSRYAIRIGGVQMPPAEFDHMDRSPNHADKEQAMDPTRPVPRQQNDHQGNHTPHRLEVATPITPHGGGHERQNPQVGKRNPSNNCLGSAAPDSHKTDEKDHCSQYHQRRLL